jgi:hypothetical protein
MMPPTTRALLCGIAFFLFDHFYALHIEFVSKVLLQFAEIPVAQFLGDRFLLFVPGVSLNTINITDRNLLDSIRPAPVNKLF